MPPGVANVPPPGDPVVPQNEPDEKFATVAFVPQKKQQKIDQSSAEARSRRRRLGSHGICTPAHALRDSGE
jgi:hypothetical protein